MTTDCSICLSIGLVFVFVCVCMPAQVTHREDLPGHNRKWQRNWVRGEERDCEENRETKRERCFNWFWVTVWISDLRRGSPPAHNELSSGRSNHHHKSCHASWYHHGNLWPPLPPQRFWVSQLQRKNDLTRVNPAIARLDLNVCIQCNLQGIEYLSIRFYGWVGNFILFWIKKKKETTDYMIRRMMVSTAKAPYSTLFGVWKLHIILKYYTVISIALLTLEWTF